MKSIAELLCEQTTGVTACTASAWTIQEQERQRRESEKAAREIAELMELVGSQVQSLIEEVREVRAKEKELLSTLEEIGKPFAYAKEGLNVNDEFGEVRPEYVRLEQILPLIAQLGRDKTEFGFSKDDEHEIPEDWQMK